MLFQWNNLLFDVTQIIDIIIISKAKYMSCSRSISKIQDIFL